MSDFTKDTLQLIWDLGVETTWLAWCKKQH